MKINWKRCTLLSLTLAAVLWTAVGCGGPEFAPEGEAGAPENVQPPADDPPPPPPG